MTVHYDVAGHVARVTLDRPERLNAVNRAMESELQRIWQDIEQRRDVRCIVLTGTGDRCFCSGADIYEASESGRDGLAYWAAPRPGGFGGIATRTTLSVPVIVRANGSAYGGGFEMVLGADMVIAADHAQFGLTEPRIGFLPLDGGMVMLQRQIPFKQAMGMLLTGRKVGAAELAGYGLLNDVVPADTLDTAVQRWVDDVLACSPRSLRAIKQVVRHTAHLSVTEAMGQRLPELIECLQGPDGDEGALAFREKRAPNWPD